MKFLAISENRADPTPHLAAESARMEQLCRSGLVEQVFLKVDRSGAVLVAEASDAQAVRTALDSLPLVEQGVTTFSVTEIVTL